MPPRIGAPATTPRTTTPARPAERRAAPTTPARPQATGWVNGAAPARKPPVLGNLTGTLVDAKVADTGPGKVASSIAGVPVKEARAQKYEGLTGTKALMHASTDVRFGKLSQSQFDALKSEFGGQSKVPFDATRVYSAIDFLPPALQGLVNKDVDAPKPVELKGTASLREMGEGDFTVALSPNCHGTAWEAMRAFQGQTQASHALFYGDAVTADAAYATEATFKTLGNAKPGEPPDALLKQLKAGDVVTFSEYVEGMGDTTLLHSAVYAGGGLFFEKPDTEDDSYSETPYRLVTWDQMKAPIADYLGGEPSLTARRPQQPLPSGVTQFSTSDEAALTKWAEKKGTTLGKPLVLELEMGMGGGVRGMHASAYDAHKVTLGANGRGVIE